VRRGLVTVVALLIAAPAASGARAQITIQATPAAGAAPLHVTFTAADAVAAHWDFGDGSGADGVTVEHVYAAGRWTAAATVRAERPDCAGRDVHDVDLGVVTVFVEVGPRDDQRNGSAVGGDLRIRQTNEAREIRELEAPCLRPGPGAPDKDDDRDEY